MVAESPGLMTSAIIYLAAAVIAVPIAKRAGLGSVLGYLIAGIAIGPWGLGLIQEGEHILHFAEFGVVMLLFLIGLELNPKRLWAMRRPIIGMGGLQVIGTLGVITALGLAFGLPWRTALLAGMGLALSSTAIALQTIQEKHWMKTEAGASGFAVLLFQDIAVIPMLAVLPLLSLGGEEVRGDWTDIAKVVGAVLAIVVGGRYLIRPLFRFIAKSQLREIFTATSLLLVIGIAGLMHEAGISMALGAFLAGVLLAESEYRHELEVDIEPFKGLLMGLFFIAVGMTVDFGLLMSQPLLIVGLALAIVALKFVLLFGLARGFGMIPAEKPLFAVLLSQCGEFGFVLFNTAATEQVISGDTRDLLNVVVTLSMLTTPFLLIAVAQWERRFRQQARRRPEDSIDKTENPVIIAGYGRFGQVIGRLMMANRIPATIIDHDPDHVDLLRRFGFKLFYGDATRLDLLHTAGAENAKVLVAAMDEEEAVLKLVDLARQHFPHLQIIARAAGRTQAYALIDRGVTLYERETFWSALRLGEETLKQLGFGAYEAHKAALRFRQHDQRVLEEMQAIRQDEQKLITKARKARDDLEKLFDEEYGHRDLDRDKDW